ncbi:copia-type polyprotein, partial [Trifolium medium]|nr:copia-type polyprotein [Trifolium medium]
MVKGLPPLEDTADHCVNCLAGKQHRESIPKQAKWRASKKLELVHTDICGPITPQSNGGNRYFITFTDDYTRKTWVYVLKDKAGAFEIFKVFKALVEKESGCPIICLRSDRGGEYTSNAFNEFCRVEGIKRQLTAAYTPQQNGVSERKNRTLLNIVRSMISAKGVPKQFWPEAVLWAVYVMNRSPTTSVKDKTPEEAWSGVKPSVKHFNKFGCLAHVHVNDVNRKKLDSKSKICVLLGISEESKAYKLYDPTTKKIIISRDVVFEESKGWNWSSDQKSKVISEDLVDDEEISDIPVENVSINEEEHDGQEENVDNVVVDDSTSASENEEGARSLTRIRKPSVRLEGFVTGREAEESDEEDLNNFAIFKSEDDPVDYDEAAKLEIWRKAMDAEIEAIEKNDTWELTTLPAGLDKHKARLVAKGYTQRYGIDYSEVFAPVARWDTIRTVLSMAANNGWDVFQMDVKSAFLHGELTENIYVSQPLGYDNGNKHKVYKLKKALYGLKQAPRAWYSKIETYFISKSFQKCPHEHTLFVKLGEKGEILIASLYVDDLILTGNDLSMINNFKRSMKKHFAMTDLGKMRYFLGIEVCQSKQGIFIHQQKYAAEILSRFGMENCNMVSNPIVPGCKLIKNENGKAADPTLYKQMVGCLMYLLATRPDLAYSVCLVARFMDRPTEVHFTAVKRILRYLKGTLSFGVLYKSNVTKKLCLKGWSDSDYAGDVEDRKSTTGYLFKLGSAAISWSSKKQPIVTLSTTEAEYVAAASCACQALWLRNVLSCLQQKQEVNTVIYCDNSSTIKLSKNPIMHGRCKHIDVRFHFLRNLTKDDVVELIHCKTDSQLADIFTKPLKLDS